MADHGEPSTTTTSSSANDDIELSAPAVVAWVTSDNEARHLADVTLEIRRDASRNTAFFKLRSTIVFKALAPVKSGLFLFVHPERIHSLDLDESDVEASAQLSKAKKTLSSDTACLRFSLARHADLVGPAIPSLTPKNRVNGDLLDLMRSLVGQTSFSVYLPQNVSSKARMRSLCKAASNGSMRSIPRQADIASLYQGRGGQLINVSSTCDIGSPPSYDEVEPSPPAASASSGGKHTPQLAISCHLAHVPPGSVSKKRRRDSSGADAGRTFNSKQVESLCKEMLDRQKAEILKVLEERESRLYDRLVAYMKPCLSRELQSLEKRITEQVEKRLGQQVEQQEDEVDRRLQALEKDLNETIVDQVEQVGNRIEDEFYGLRLRLEEYIKDELAEAEGRITEDLESRASVSLQFNP